jgi:drug/metabolite transporter (DMT)-like permease
MERHPMDVFNVAFTVGLLAPALVVGTFAFLWRPALQHPWWFVGLSGVSLYVLMAIFVTYALSNIGLSGSPPLTAAGPVDAVMRHYCLSMLAWSISGVLILFAIRYFLSKV